MLPLAAPAALPLPPSSPAAAAAAAAGALPPVTTAVEASALADEQTVVEAAAPAHRQAMIAATVGAEDSTMAAAETEDSTMAAATASGASVVSTRGQWAVKRAACTQLVVQQQEWAAEIVARRQQRALAWAWASWFSWYGGRAIARAKAVQGQQIWQVRQQKGSLDDQQTYEC